MNWTIEPFVEKRRVRSIQWSDGQGLDDNADRHFYIHRDPLNHEVWVVQMNEDREVCRFNARFVESIEWY